MTEKEKDATVGKTAGDAKAPDASPAADAKAKAKPAAAPPGRKKVDGSLKFILGYAKRECC